MEIIAIILTLVSALGAYQFFLWLYKRQFRPDILIGILPHYEVTNEGIDISEFGDYCIANEFMFNPAYFAQSYDVDDPTTILNGTKHESARRKVLRDDEGRCRLPIIIQNLGKGFSKELFYVVSFYEHPPQSKMKSGGFIKIDNLLMERRDKCYLYTSRSMSEEVPNHLVTSDEVVCQMYDDIGLFADYVYFESFLEPKAFVLNLLDLHVSRDISEFTILFNIFSLQNDRLMISKFQHCCVIDQVGDVKITEETANKSMDGDKE